ncbi:3-oxoacyl-ACP synthase III family protein [Spirochaeta dissipatitropha]
MPLHNLYLHGVGHFHPDTVIDNKFLEDLDIGTSDSWIMERVGIRTRRSVLPLDYIRDTRNADPRAAHEAAAYSNAECGARAARMAMDRAGISPDQVGMVIAGGCSPQYSIPAEACTIANELGISAPCFDLGSACSSFAAQIGFLEQMRSERMPDYILTVNVENTTKTVDYTDRNTAVLWGDGTAAAIVSSRLQGPIAVTHSLLHSDPTGWDKVCIPSGGFFRQNGPAVQGFAIRKSGACLKELSAQLSRKDYWFIGHQANLLMLQSVISRAGISPERHLYNVNDFGNCGAAGAPGVLSQNWNSFQAEDEIALAVVGSGLTWGALALKVLQSTKDQS